MSKKKSRSKDQNQSARLLSKRSHLKKYPPEYPTLLEVNSTTVIWEGDPTDEQLRKSMEPGRPSEVDLFNSDPKAVEKLSDNLTMSYDDENIILQYEGNKTKIPFSNIFRIPNAYRGEIPISQLLTPDKEGFSDDEVYQSRKMERAINPLTEEYIGGRSEKKNLRIFKEWIDREGILPIGSENIRQIALDINKKLVYLINYFMPGVRIPSFSRLYSSGKSTFPGLKKPKTFYRLKFAVIPAFSKYSLD